MSVSHMVCELEDREARRLGVPVSIARIGIARRMNEAPGTLENIRRDRTKSPSFSIVQKIRNLFIAELTAEIWRLEHEIFLAQEGGLDLAADEMVAAQAHLDAAKKLIGDR